MRRTRRDVIAPDNVSTRLDRAFDGLLQLQVAQRALASASILLEDTVIAPDLAKSRATLIVMIARLHIYLDRIPK